MVALSAAAPPESAPSPALGSPSPALGSASAPAAASPAESGAAESSAAPAESGAAGDSAAESIAAGSGAGSDAAAEATDAELRTRFGRSYGRFARSGLSPEGFAMRREGVRALSGGLALTAADAALLATGLLILRREPGWAPADLGTAFLIVGGLTAIAGPIAAVVGAVKIARSRKLRRGAAAPGAGSDDEARLRLHPLAAPGFAGAALSGAF